MWACDWHRFWWLGIIFLTNISRIYCTISLDASFLCVSRASCCVRVCRCHRTRCLPVKVFSRQMQLGRPAGADPEGALWTDEPEQVRPWKLWLHRLLERRHRHRRLALFWAARLQSPCPWRELHEHEAVPRGSQALSVGPVLMCQRSVTAAGFCQCGQLFVILKDLSFPRAQVRLVFGANVLKARCYRGSSSSPNFLKCKCEVVDRRPIYAELTLKINRGIWHFWGTLCCASSIRACLWAAL